MNPNQLRELDKQADELKDLLQSLFPTKENEQLILEIHRVIHCVLVAPESPKTRKQVYELLGRTNGLRSNK